jgi:membrane associated rhomboid family serine protease
LVCGLGAFALYEFTVGLQVYQLTGSFAPETVSEALLSQVSQLYYTPVVGASGAIFGILLGFGMLFPNTQLMLLFPPIPIKAKWFVIIYGAIELFGGFNQLGGAADNVAHFAHLGGMLFGFLMIQYWKKKKNSLY